ncbi:hypothetical protein MBLNU457_7435t2 [Dothideomycetes sp. NU457]
MFRNQTNLVTRRATKKTQTSQSKQPSPMPISSTSPDTSVDEEIHRDLANTGSYALQPVKPPYYLESNNSTLAAHPNFWLTKGPTVPLSDQAVAIFFKHLVIPAYYNRHTQGWLQYLAPMYHEAEEDSPLRLATGAAAVAGLAKRPDTLSLSPLAVDLYSRAIKAVHRALRNPEQNKADDTLAATILLSLYECASPMDANVEAWGTHVAGAAAIVRARGEEILNSPRSLALFRVTRTQMLTNCIRSQSCPTELPIEGGWLADVKYLSDPSYSLAKNIFLLPQLFAKGKRLLRMPLTPQLVQDIESVIEEGFATEQKMREWRPLQQSEWHPKTVRFTQKMPQDLKKAESWIGPVYEWQTMHTAAIVNKQRAAQLTNAYLIIECFKKIYPDTYESDPRYRKACYILQSNIDEICYSIPFFFGAGMGPERTRMHVAGSGMMEAIGAYHLIWPVSVAYGCPMISDEQREWLAGRIDVISVYYGLDQAIVVREIFQKNMMNGNLMGM